MRTVYGISLVKPGVALLTHEVSCVFSQAKWLHVYLFNHNVNKIKGCKW